jgi:outer membrane receptor protein involved in Fe transport
MGKLVLRCSCLLALIAFALPAPSQVQNGEFTGLITDPSGAIVNQARVMIHNIGTGFKLEVRSNEHGVYKGGELIVGQYQISVQMSGFRTATSGALMLNAGTVVRADFTLQIGARDQIVEVSDAALEVNTENSRLSETVDSTMIANLPLNGRNVYDLIQYAPGATNVRGVMFENGANTVVNGVRENFNGFLINGVSNKSLSGGPINQPIQDTVQEFQLVTLNNSAEFSNSAGAITSLVTKSGTNQLHGSAWEYFRNDALDANPFFANHDPDPANRPKTPLHLNQFGGTVGGPIMKNKLFLFGAYQGDRFLTSSPAPVQVESSQFRNASIAAFPDSVAALLYKSFPPATQGTPLMTLRDYVTGGFSESGFSSFAQYLCPSSLDPNGFDSSAAVALSNRFAHLFGVEQTDIDQMNALNKDGCSGGSPFGSPQAGEFNRDDAFLEEAISVNKSQVEGNLFNGNEASLRLDFNAGPKDRLFSQFNWARSTNRYIGGVHNFRGFLNPSKVTTPNFQFSYIHTFSPTVLNEFRAGYAGSGNDISVDLPGVPGIGFDDGTQGFGSYNGYPQTFHENIYTYADMVSVNYGKHSIKAGIDVRRNIENSNFNVGRPSYYFFDSLFFATDAPYVEFAGIDPGFTEHTTAQLETSIRHWRNWEVGAYFQDDWKVGRRLTLNLGLRYDIFTRHTELNNLSTTFLKGPGMNLIDNITTGAGQIKDASIPCPGNPRAPLAGVCGSGGFAPASALGAGDHNNFGPRIGFAWDVFGDGRTSFRGGFGLSYEGTLYNPLSNTRWNPPYYSVEGAVNFLGGDISHIVYGPVGGGPANFVGSAPPGQNSGSGVQATGNISGWDPSNPHIAANTAIVFPEGIRDPYVENWFLGVQHQVRAGIVIQLNYVGTAGHKLFRAEGVNRIPGARLPEGTCVIDTFGRKLCSQVNTNRDANGFVINPVGRLNPNQGNLRVWENVGNSIYHGLQLSVQKRMSHGLQIGGNYTWSHAIDSGSTWHNGQATANGFAAGDAYTTDVTLPWLDRGNAIFDIRHRLTFNYVWQLPFFETNHSALGTVLSGWQWNGIWSFQSGAHWSPYQGGGTASPRFDDKGTGACDPATFDPTQCFNVGSDYNLDGAANDRPNAIANHVDATHAQWADGFNLPDGFFTAPCLACVGNLGRNTFVGPGYWGVDTSIFKSFQLSDRFRLQFRAEAFNIFNHTNFQLGGATAPTAINKLDRAQFGQAGGTFNPRQLQFGLKLSF